MKKQLILSALVCLLANVCLAQKKYEMVIEKTDGTSIVVNTEDIIRVYFQERTGSGNEIHNELIYGTWMLTWEEGYETDPFTGGYNYSHSPTHYVHFYQFNQDGTYKHWGYEDWGTDHEFYEERDHGTFGIDAYNLMWEKADGKTYNWEYEILQLDNTTLKRKETWKDGDYQITTYTRVNDGGGQQSYQSCPDDHHPHMIDLGLPSGTKWACCNLGATTPEAYGGYFAWGETEEKVFYSRDNYKYNHQSLGGDIAGTNYDMALVVWGRTWQMPSLEQIKELLDNCNFQWTSVNGINGGKFISKNNGASVFLPAAGRFDEDERDFYGRGSLGYYWTSTQSTKDDDDAYDLDFEDGEAYWGDDDRSRGQTVRPVSK